MAIIYHDGYAEKIEPPDNEELSALLTLQGTYLYQIAEFAEQGTCTTGRLLEIIKGQQESINFLTRRVAALSDHISTIYKELHELAPQKELIDLLHMDDDAERLEAINAYMNHGPGPEDEE